jgi:hypothetical protein
MDIFICCSKYFYNRISPIQEELKQRGHDIILPNCYDSPQTEYQIMRESAEAHTKWKGEMFAKSEKQIKGIDVMLILNYQKNGIDNYIGGATFLEMYDAFRHQKPIYLINPLPENILKDELRGFNPIILNGELKKIRGY